MCQRRTAKSDAFRSISETFSAPNSPIKRYGSENWRRKLVAPQPLTDPWQHCLNRLGGDIPQQQFNTWIRPLQAEWQESGLVLAAPNRFIRDFVAEKYLPMISRYLLDVVPPAAAHASVTVAGSQPASLPSVRAVGHTPPLSPARPAAAMEGAPRPAPAALVSPSSLVEGYTFERFVEGKSNQLALAAAQQVAEHPGNVIQPAVPIRRCRLGQNAPDARGGQCDAPKKSGGKNRLPAFGALCC